MKNTVHSPRTNKDLHFEPTIQSPSIFIALPFEPKVMSKQIINEKLKWALHQVETDLMRQFPRAVVMPAIYKLKTVFHNLDYTTLRKSITIFLSPFIEKVYYLNVSVNERVVVNQPFSFRSLVYNKKEEKKCLLLVVDDESARIYQADNSNLKLVLYHSLKQGAGKPLSNQSSTVFISNSLKKKLREVDTSLHLLQKAFNLPVVVMANEGALEMFQSITKNSRNILHCVKADFEIAEQKQITEALKPACDNWQKLRLNHLLNQLEENLSIGKLAVGICDVWRAAKERRTKVLVVEENYTYPAYTTEDQKMIYSDIIPINHSYLATDAVDEAIEFVLAGGGDVVFVEPGVLKDHLHIALF